MTEAKHTEAMRAEFEAWAAKRGYDLRPWKGVGSLGPYSNIRTSDVYTGWQAASAGKAELLEALKDLYANVRGEASWMFDDTRGGSDRLALKVEAAISRATGEQDTGRESNGGEQ